MHGKGQQVIKFATFICAFLENFLFSGLVFGWSSLVFVLKKEGIFSHLCRGNNQTNSSIESIVGCKEQDEVLNLSYTISSVVPPSLSIVLGLIYDRCGLRFSRLTGGWVLMYTHFSYLRWLMRFKVCSILYERCFERGIKWASTKKNFFGKKQVHKCCFQMVLLSKIMDWGRSYCTCRGKIDSVRQALHFFKSNFILRLNFVSISFKSFINNE